MPFDWELGDKEKTDAAMAGVHHVTTLEFTNQRLVPNAIEPRCAIGDYDDSRQHHTLYYNIAKSTCDSSVNVCFCFEFT